MPDRHTLRDADPNRWGQGDDFRDEDFENPYGDRDPSTSGVGRPPEGGAVRVIKHHASGEHVAEGENDQLTRDDDAPTGEDRADS